MLCVLVDLVEIVDQARTCAARPRSSACSIDAASTADGVTGGCPPRSARRHTEPAIRVRATACRRGARRRGGRRRGCDPAIGQRSAKPDTTSIVAGGAVVRSNASRAMAKQRCGRLGQRRMTESQLRGVDPEVGGVLHGAAHLVGGLLVVEQHARDRGRRRARTVWVAHRTSEARASPWVAPAGRGW